MPKFTLNSTERRNWLCSRSIDETQPTLGPPPKRVMKNMERL